MVDRHMVNVGQEVWCLIDGQPRKLRFFRLLPYNGFLAENEEGEEENFGDDATFAESRNELLRHHMWKIADKITRLNEEKDRLFGLLHPEEPATQQDAQGGGVKG